MKSMHLSWLAILSFITMILFWVRYFTDLSNYWYIWFIVQAVIGIFIFANDGKAIGAFIILVLSLGMFIMVRTWESEEEIDKQIRLYEAVIATAIFIISLIAWIVWKPKPTRSCDVQEDRVYTGVNTFDDLLNTNVMFFKRELPSTFYYADKWGNVGDQTHVNEKTTNIMIELAKRGIFSIEGQSGYCDEKEGTIQRSYIQFFTTVDIANQLKHALFNDSRIWVAMEFPDGQVVENITKDDDDDDDIVVLTYDGGDPFTTFHLETLGENRKHISKYGNINAMVENELVCCMVIDRKECNDTMNVDEILLNHMRDRNIRHRSSKPWNVLVVCANQADFDKITEELANDTRQANVTLLRTKRTRKSKKLDSLVNNREDIDIDVVELAEVETLSKYLEETSRTFDSMFWAGCLDELDDLYKLLEGKQRDMRVYLMKKGKFVSDNPFVDQPIAMLEGVQPSRPHFFKLFH